MTKYQLVKNPMCLVYKILAIHHLVVWLYLAHPRSYKQAIFLHRFYQQKRILCLYLYLLFLQLCRWIISMTIFLIPSFLLIFSCNTYSCNFYNIGLFIIDLLTCKSNNYLKFYLCYQAVLPLSSTMYSSFKIQPNCFLDILISSSIIL